MKGSLRDWQIRQREFREQVAAHRKQKLAGCQCVHCIGVEGVGRLLEKRLREQEERNGEIPF